MFAYIKGSLEMNDYYNKNKDEFETFANETIMKMENIKIQNDKIKYQLEALEESTKDDNIQDKIINNALILLLTYRTNVCIM